MVMFTNLTTPEGRRFTLIPNDLRHVSSMYSLTCLRGILNIAIIVSPMAISTY